jgi:hypothetical protein
MDKNIIDWIAIVLVILGGLNWGLIGILNFDLVVSLFGAMSTITRVIYSLVGIAALWMIYFAFKK